MVFEVINDRRERLKPYEVLKGKLLGQIDKDELDHYYDVWQNHIHALQSIGENEVENMLPEISDVLQTVFTVGARVVITIPGRKMQFFLMI